MNLVSHFHFSPEWTVLYLIILLLGVGIEATLNSVQLSVLCALCSGVTPGSEAGP